MNPGNTLRNFLLYAAGSLLVMSAQATAIYQQGFSGAATTAIGTAPTIRPGNEVWVSLISGNRTNPFLLNGNAYSGAGGMCLPFTPAAGNIYKLSASIDRTSNTGDWISIGFNDTLVGSSFTGAGLGTVIIRGDSQPTDGNAFNGPGVGGQLPDFNFDNDGVNVVEIILDATSADSALWMMEYRVGGTSVGGPSLRNDASGDFGNISFVGFSHGGATGAIRDFSLSITSTIPVIPEPPPAPPAITSFTPVGGNIWEADLRADRDTSFEFRSSATLDFTPGTLVENLTQGQPGTDPGIIGGTNHNRITTGPNGNAKVRMPLAGNPQDFVRAAAIQPNYGFGKFSDVRIVNKFGKWPEKKTVPYYRATFGCWFTVYWTGPEDVSYAHWPEWTRVTPSDFGRYSCNDPDYLKTTFTRLKNIGVDFLTLDDTNGHWNDLGLIDRNINTIYAVAQELGDRSPQIAISTGQPLAAGSAANQLVENDYYMTNYVKGYPDKYFMWKNKPFLLVYTVPFKPTFTDSRFSIRRGSGFISWGKSSLIEQSQGLWGWVFDTQMPGSEVMGVQPGYDRNQHAHDGSTVFLRNNGQRYIDMWLAAIKQNPEAIILPSWNDHGEETGVEAANWFHGEDPYLYERITEGYLALRYGCIDGFYYRTEGQTAVYQYLAATNRLELAPPSSVPSASHIPVIVVPVGYFSWAGLQP